VREALALVGVLAIPAFNATAAGAAPAPGVRAVYHGRTINLAQGWQGAQGCAVFSANDVRCFDTRAQLRDAVAAAARAGTAAAPNDAAPPPPSCGGSSTSVQLFSGTDWSGNELVLSGTSGWVNLADYGFDNDMESWANSKTCNATLADGTAGGGAQLTLGANSYSLNAGSWKNRASSENVIF
jgi:hypothetical protein